MKVYKCRKNEKKKISFQKTKMNLKKFMCLVSKFLWLPIQNFGNNFFMFIVACFIVSGFQIFNFIFTCQARKIFFTFPLKIENRLCLILPMNLLDIIFNYKRYFCKTKKFLLSIFVTAGEI